MVGAVRCGGRSDGCVWGDDCLEVLVDVIVIIIIHVCVCVYVCVTHTHTHR